MRDILQRSIPPEREQDVVLIDLANTVNPPPLNPLRGLAGEIAVARTVDIFNKLYPDLRDLPQTSDVLENALMTLHGLPDAILWDVDRLFASSTFRTQLLTKSKDPVVKRFWREEYEELARAEQIRLSSPISRRLRRFYRSEDLRAIICHPQGIDFGRLVQERKIVLVSLRARENTIPEQEQRLIGALVISRLQMAAMNEAFREVPCYCYIDELQNFVTTSIDQVFSEARKFNLSLTMANQFLQQLKGDALHAAMGNVSTLAVFQVGQDDARALAVYTKPGFEVDDLTSLDKYSAALWMRYDSATETAFSLTTFSPLPLPNNAQEIEGRIRAQSIQQYTPMTREEVISWLEARDEENRKVDHVETDPNEEWFDTSHD